MGRSVLDKIWEIYSLGDESLNDLVSVGFLECLISKDPNLMKKLSDSLPSEELKELLHNLLAFWYRSQGFDLLSGSALPMHNPFANPGSWLVDFDILR